jgi:hypothetical protein
MGYSDQVNRCLTGAIIPGTPLNFDFTGLRFQ